MKRDYGKFKEKCNSSLITIFFPLLAAFLLIPSFLFAKEVTLTGKITTDAGEAVYGATVMVQGTTIGTSTDAKGAFILHFNSQNPQDDKLVIKYLGYTTQIIPIGNKTSFKIKLSEEQTVLDDVVVVGYGTAKKKDLTGALSNVSGNDIIKRQTENISVALQGVMPGVTVTRSNSAPGEDATIRVRGITTISSGASSPYILIDGVPGNLSDVNPNDIANLTVLKDAASASIYGSQAAAGVILVTTKRGTSGHGSSVNYNYTLGIDIPTDTPDYMDAVGYMSAINELRYNDLPASGWYQEFGQEYVENYWEMNRQNPDLYPNTDWTSLLLKKSAPRQSHNLSIQSNGDMRSTLMSFGYDDVDGLFTKNLKWRRYTARVNNDLQLYKWLKASTDISLRYIDKLNPHSSPSTSMRYIPGIYNAIWSDGRYAPGKDGMNVYAALMDGGTKNSDTYQASAKFQLDITPIKDLTVTALFSPRFSYVKSKDFCKQVPYFGYQDENTVSTKYISEANQTTLEERRGDTFAHTTQFYANYQHTFNNMHNFSAMVGYENYWYQEETLIAKKSSFAHSLIPDLNAGGTEDVVARTEDVNELARRSVFGRLMYNYASKYYVQGNLRRDGSSRFASNSRWGTFPSASVGWVFTNENFLAPVRTAFDHGKLRVSYGELGNERINGYYPYQTVLTPGYPVGIVGGEVSALPAYSQTAAVVSNVTWETTSTIDVGLDLTTLNNRLSFSGDWYKKKTRNMLLQVPIAPIMGLSDPYDNIGDMHTKGWEITLGWRDAIGDFTYAASFNLSDDVSKMGYIGNKEIISGGKIIKQGVEYNSWYGYLSDGLYQTQEEVDNTPKMGTVYPGDVRYKNLADADENNPLISPEYDRKVLGSSLPHFNYGGSIDMGWKGLDFNLVFQGVGKRNSYLSEAMVAPLRSQWYNVPTLIGNGKSWSSKNTAEQNLSARYPRYSWASNTNNYSTSDFWLFDGSYFRIKNITLGYTLPEKWMSKASVKSLRFAFSLSDFFTISHYPKGWDPEVSTTAYPITKSAIFTASLKF